MLFSNRRAALFLLSAVAALLLVSRIPRRPRDVPRTRELRTDASLENAPGDAGAGLSAILAISLPKSTERRQMMTEMAALTGLKVEFIDATTSAASQVNLTRQVLGEVSLCLFVDIWQHT